MNSIFKMFLCYSFETHLRERNYHVFCVFVELCAKNLAPGKIVSSYRKAESDYASVSVQYYGAMKGGRDEYISVMLQERPHDTSTGR